jgi:hypothetical protein
MYIVKKKITFSFEPVKSFNTITEAQKYCDNVIKRIIKKNIKAKKDFRPNAYGVEEIPFFMINNSLYVSNFDPYKEGRQKYITK